MSRNPLPPLWMSLWAPFLALAWLLPNHYYPWATFHTDAWVAGSMALAAAAVIVRSTSPISWHGVTLMVAMLSIVPFVQFFAGMIPFSGQAWLYSAYLIGLLVAILAGAHWEAETPGRAVEGLFLAIAIASMASVAMQLRQWIGIEVEPGELAVWTAEFTPGRPSANLGQPNQLADILLWGLLACGWAVVKHRARAKYGILAATIIIFGLALTQSRAGSLGLFAIALGTWHWRRFLPPRSPQLVALLFAYLLVCSSSLQHLSEFLGLDVVIRPTTLGGESSLLRLKAYALFFDAVVQRPLAGYGWDQLAVAQLEVAQNHGTLASFFLHSHNLFLDLVLWCGLPLGGFIAISLAWWLFWSIKNVASSDEVILVLFLIVIGLHAMVELPLHHAYLLLPTGFVMGVLNERQRNKIIFRSGKCATFMLLVGACFLFGAIVRDYLRSDESFRRYRLDSAHIGNLPAGLPPDVLILNQMHQFIVSARSDVSRGFTEADLPALLGVTTSFPTPANLFNYCKALALLNRPIEARDWLIKVQRVQPVGFDSDMRLIWINQAKKSPAMAAVQWPEEDLSKPSKLYSYAKPNPH